MFKYSIQKYYKIDFNEILTRKILDLFKIAIIRFMLNLVNN